MIKKILITGAVLGVLVGAFGYCGSGCWFSPRLTGAYVEFRDALVGGDLYAGASLALNDNLTIAPTLYTWQTGKEWSTYGGVLRATIVPTTDFGMKLYLWGGGTYDRVDLRTASGLSSNLAQGIYTRFVPAYGVGVGVDSVRFFCDGCNYFFSGKLLVGDFATPTAIQFNGINAPSAPETLSTLVIGDVLLNSPLGAVGVVRHVRTRGWFDDNWWRVSYTCPYCCGGLFRVRLGWESGYLGFADFEVKIDRFSVIAGVKIPTETSLWMWRTGIEFRPAAKKSSSFRDIQILSPRGHSIY